MEEPSDPVGSGAIWTPDRRVRVFVSSTLGELAPERAAARAAIEEMHLTPVLFELGARPHPPRALYAAYLGQSDVFLGIYWQRYGWVGPGATLSGLEDEFELSSGLPRLMYVKEPAPDREGGLTKLLDRLEAEGSVSYRRFRSPEELRRLIADDLAVLLSERFGATPSSSASSEQRWTVPVPLTPTIGRRREIAAVTRLIRRGVRLVTITGTGGVGKSRLATMVALELAGERSRDAYFIPLSPLVDPRLLLATIADHVGARLANQTPLDALADCLRERDVLLVLDNFEHLAAAGPDLVTLLDRCPDLQVLVTSRHVLRVRGEHEFTLAPLDVPSPTTSVRTSAAVKLFVERGAAVRPGFALTAGNEQPIAELCRRLDGLPLALELAAARLRLLEPDELLERIGARLDLLASGAADLPQRQRALRATLDWSHNLLTPTEQTLFARLSVFVGGATIGAAEAVCGDDEVPDVLGVMASLLEKSLLVHLATEAGPGRLQMLHVVRAYAWDRLGARGQVELLRERQARWFLELVRSLEAGGLRDDRWHPLDAEIDNIRAVLSWALDQADLAPAGVLARGLRSWWWVRGMVPEALEWLEKAYAMGARLGPTSLEMAWIAFALGHLQQLADRSDEAEARLRTALDLFAAHDDADGVIASRLALAATLADRERRQEATALAREALDQGREERRDDIVEWASSILGTFLAVDHDLDGARAAQEEARDAAVRLGSQVALAMAHHQLAMVELMAGRREECWRELGLAAAIYGHTPHLEGISYALEVAAAACLVEGDVDEATDAAALAQELHERLRLPIWHVLRPLHARLMAQMRRASSTREHRPAAPSSDPAAVLQRMCDQHLTRSA